MQIEKRTVILDTTDVDISEDDVRRFAQDLEVLAQEMMLGALIKHAVAGTEPRQYELPFGHCTVIELEA